MLNGKRRHVVSAQLVVLTNIDLNDLSISEQFYRLLTHLEEY